MASADSHRRGRAALLEAWRSVTGADPTLPELQIAGAQADLESGYGQASYRLLDHATGATLASSGPINNWGAVQTSEGPPNGFLATDTSPSKVSADNPHGYYDHHYRVYPTPADGARHLIEHMTVKRPSSWEYMRRGDIDAWAEAMHARPGKTDPISGTYGYFEQAPASRALGIERRIAEIAAALGEPIAAKRGGPAVELAPAGGGVEPSTAPVKTAAKAVGLGALFAAALTALLHWLRGRG